MRETWIMLREFPNYAVSDHGRIYNIRTDRLISPSLSEQGFLRVRLYDEDGWGHERRVHRLVAETFFEDWRRGMMLEWVDGDRTNNHVSNLRPKNPSKKVVVYRGRHRDIQHKRVRIVETNQIFKSVRDCAEYINGDFSTIYSCLRGERRSHMGYTFEYYYEDG